MILRSLLQRKPKPSEALYEQIVAAARRPYFYAELGVPDTVEGRFDMIALHMFLALNRLKGEADRQLSQDLVDVFFADMDRSLREMGVGDLTVGKKVRKIAESFYGRMDAYRNSMEDQAALTDAIARNVYAETDKVHAGSLAGWTQQAIADLAGQSVDTIREANIRFPQ
jgi:cytochrome b pre-mRNA-processing protein 3